MERRRDGETERRRDGETERRRDGETERRRDGETERRRDGETERRRDGETERFGACEPTPVEFNTNRLSDDGFLDGDVPVEPVASKDGRLGSLGQGPGVGQGLRGNAEGNGERGGQVVPAGLGLCELAELDEGGLERECRVSGDGRVWMGEWRRGGQAGELHAPYAPSDRSRPLQRGYQLNTTWFACPGGRRS